MKHNYPVIKWRRAASSLSHEFFTLAATPHEEQCTPCGYDHLHDGEYECAVLIDQLRYIHGEPPEGAEFFICENDHEFGIYHEAAIKYLIADESKDYDEMSESEKCQYEIACKALEYAQKVEMGIPDKWDEISLQHLRKAEHHLYTAKIIQLKIA